MNLNDYQQLALRTAAAKNKKNELFHLLLGLVGETGEIAEKFKKWVRDEQKIDKEDVEKELGDVLWYVAVLADYFDLKLESVADKNIQKLSSRLKRDKIQGSGDRAK